MTDSVWAVNAVTGAPAFSGKQGRQTASALIAGATSARPLGGRTGVRPGTPSSTVTATSTTWTVQPFAGVADVASSAIAGPFQFAFDAVQTGSVTAADATNPRVDIIYVQIDDPAEGDGSTVPAATRKYLAGTAAPSPVAPALPVSRAFVIANINVPASGGGSPTVTWNAPFTAAAGGVVPFLNLTALNLWSPGQVDQYADVFADATTANNGLYRWNGTTWVLVVGDTGWITPTLTNSWTVSGSQTIQYRRLNGMVILRGQATGGTASAIFTLPAGFRTTQDRYYSAVNGSSTTASTRVVVQIAGTVLPITATQPNLDGITFPADA